MATRTAFRLNSLVLPLAAVALAGCAYDGVSGQAPRYDQGSDYAYGADGYDDQGEQGYDGQWNPAWTGVEQPGDLFGGEDVASVDVFYEPLAPYGRWIETQWGRAFAPDVDRGWRPYTNGRWTEYRLWISDDPWGWATDHYGRWAHDDRIGWVWVPDTRWGPHWVAFRENEQYAGWAPIPPQVAYDIGVGFGGGYGGGFGGGGFGGGGFGGGGFGGGGFGYDDFNSWYGPSWVWAPVGAMFLPGLNRRILPYGGGRNYWQATRWQHWTPWTRNRGWVGAPGRNYWRGASPISNRIGGSLGARPGFGQPYGGGYRRPQQGWNGQPGLQRPRGDGRPGFQRPVGDGRQGWQDRRGQRPDGAAPNFGNRPPRAERPAPGNRPDRVGGYVPRPAYANGGVAQPAPRADWRGGGRQPGMGGGNRGAPGAGNAVIGNAIGGSLGARPERQARPQVQVQPRQMAAPAPMARQEAPRPAPQARAERPAPSSGPGSDGGRRDYGRRDEN